MWRVDCWLVYIVGYLFVVCCLLCGLGVAGVILCFAGGVTVWWICVGLICLMPMGVGFW